MYRKDSGEWFKHIDFIILDMICLQISFLFAFKYSGFTCSPYKMVPYRNMAIFIELADLGCLFVLDTLKNVLKRGWLIEFKKTILHVIVLILSVTLYLFVIHQGQVYSRLAISFTFVYYAVITYIVRGLHKTYLHKHRNETGKRSLLIITTVDIAEDVISNVSNSNYGKYTLSGVSLLDESEIAHIGNLPVVSNGKNVAKYVCLNWVDEVLIVTSGMEDYPQELINQLTETGVTVHLNLLKVGNLSGERQFVEKVGGYTVLTTSINYASAKQLLVKRLMDIVGGLIGCIITAILFIFIAPAIYMSSPGPIFFAQERVGKNGKTFKMYKFRSMYLDAEERKAELMKENKLGDGKMFKMDFDPRVIGNKILPDGTHKTGIGEFIRKTSLDEFPQFFNVLKGDMSIVGTRPPLISETELYELHHHARLAIKPGITGLWQVSGRSDITDFEEVVRLDREYITNWSIDLDLKILFKTIAVVLKKEGSV